MATYTVEWTITVEAESREAAARDAWRTMRKPDSSANVFQVYDEEGDCEKVDLEELDDEHAHVARAASALEAAQ